MKGEILSMTFTDYIVECADCDEEHTIEASQDTKAAAMKEFRGLGWGKRKGKWRCPSCLKAQRCAVEDCDNIVKKTTTFFCEEHQTQKVFMPEHPAKFKLEG